MSCEHDGFQAQVNVIRLSEKEGGPITGYTADVTIKCAKCGLPFRFIGLPYGVLRGQPTLSADGLELRAPIEPEFVREILGVPAQSGRA